MKSVPISVAKTALIATFVSGLAACAAPVPEPIRPASTYTWSDARYAPPDSYWPPYYGYPTYYYPPAYYYPRSAFYGSLFFSSRFGHHHHRHHHHHRGRHGGRHHR